MNRLLIASAIVVGALATATPAVAGLAGNPSFSHKLPVRVPSSGQVVRFDDRGKQVEDNRGPASSHRSSSSASATATHDAGDDHGGLSRSPEPGDDNGGATASRSPEPGDDNGGGAASRSPEPGDDRGSHSSTAVAQPTSSSQSGDDHGGSGHGSGK